jgi:hypothetical protein
VVQLIKHNVRGPKNYFDQAWSEHTASADKKEAKKKPTCKKEIGKTGRCETEKRDARRRNGAIYEL